MTSTKEETSGDPLVQLWSVSPRAQQTHPQAQRSRERCADGVEHGHLHSSAVFHLHHLLAVRGSITSYFWTIDHNCFRGRYRTGPTAR